MSVKSKITPLTAAMIIVVVIGSALATSVTFTATAYAAPNNGHPHHNNGGTTNGPSHHNNGGTTNGPSHHNNGGNGKPTNGHENRHNHRHGTIITYPGYDWNYYNNGFVAIYQLTIVANGQGTTSPSIGTYPYSAGTAVTVTAYPSVGYTLNHWTIDGVNYAPNTSITIVMNYYHTVVAYFTSGP